MPNSKQTSDKTPKQQVDELMAKHPEMANLVQTSIRMGFMEGIKRSAIVAMDHCEKQKQSSIERKVCSDIALDISILLEN